MKLRIIPAIGFLLTTGWAHAIEIDGKIDDWLLKPEGKASDWQQTIPSSVQSWVDDSVAANGFVGPGYGGQAYDAEAIYVKKDMDRETGGIYIAIVTGLSPTENEYPSGDIAFDFGFAHGDNDSTTDVLTRSFEYGLVTLEDATGVNAPAGSLYAVDPVAGWNYGLWNGDNQQSNNNPNDFSKAHPTTIKSGVSGGATAPELLNDGNPVQLKYELLNGDYASIGSQGGSHYAIETFVPWSAFNDDDLIGQSFLVHWTMACANDFVEVDPPAANSVPTPAPALLLFAGLIPLLRRQR